jgi:hypothetical protein
MSECISEKNLGSAVLNKQQKLLKIIMEEGEKIHKMENSLEKGEKEEILNFLVELQILLARRIISGNVAH